jgi:glycosyltransferase involved in cell wall biosynthesis
MARISVVMPTFNRAATLPRAIDSVLGQTHGDVELIVVDDGSTDALTRDVMAGLVRDGYHVLRQAHQGLAAAQNAGISVARGRYILPLDADHRIRPDYLRVGIDIMDHGPRIGVVYGDRELFGEISGRPGEPFSLQRLLVANVIDAGAVFRRAVWEECGGYDTTMPDRLGYEDWEFWIQAAKRGWQFAHVAEVMLEYRVRPDSMARRCDIPEHHSRLVRYLALKHRDVYATYLPEVLAAHALTAAGDRAQASRLAGELAATRAALARVDSERARASQEHEALAARHEAVSAELSSAHREGTRLEGELAVARQEIAALRQAHQGVRDQHAQLARRCVELQDTILRMRASLFWKLRGIWVRLRRLRDPHWS